MSETTMSPLRRRMIEDMTGRHFSADTQRNYIRGVSDCLERSSRLWRAPWLVVPEHGIEDHQELAHGGGERELFGFAGTTRRR